MRHYETLGMQWDFTRQNETMRHYEKSRDIMRQHETLREIIDAMGQYETA